MTLTVAEHEVVNQVSVGDACAWRAGAQNISGLVVATMVAAAQSCSGASRTSHGVRVQPRKAQVQAQLAALCMRNPVTCKAQAQLAALCTRNPVTCKAQAQVAVLPWARSVV